MPAEEEKSEDLTASITREEADKIFHKLRAEMSSRNPSHKKNWTDQEGKLLEYAVLKYARAKQKRLSSLKIHDWKEIADFVPGRTESQCLYKWNLTRRQTSFSKSSWTLAEDEILKSLVYQHKNKQW